jgi:hypothetical protein
MPGIALLFLRFFPCPARKSGAIATTLTLCGITSKIYSVKEEKTSLVVLAEK